MAGERHDLGHDLAIKRGGQLEAPEVESTDDVGHYCRQEIGIAEILPLRAECQEETLACLEPFRFHNMSRTTWRVVAEYVLLSRIMSCPGRRRGDRLGMT